MSFTDHFIYEAEGVLSREYCNKVIYEGVKTLEYFDRLETEVTDKKVDSMDLPIGAGKDQFDGIFGRHDRQIFIPYAMDQHFAPILSCVNDHLNEYRKLVEINVSVLHCPVFKWQETPVGGGFSTWHFEQGGGNASNRLLTWMIYLNDVDDGGDTEFLYQKKKCKSEAGKIVIWPAGLTHPHRGNPPYSNVKYVVTGWFVAPFDRDVERGLVQVSKGT